jgi:uncharacterized protein (TIGR03067 family)
MKSQAFFAVILACCIARPSRAAEPDPTDDVKKLAGVWKGYVVNGRGEQPNQGPVKLEITVKGETILAVQDGSKDLGEGTYTLKFTKDGKHIDAVRSKNPGKGQTFLGIYSLEGDTLKWCVSTPKKDRPADFITKTGQFLLILKRDKS